MTPRTEADRTSCMIVYEAVQQGMNPFKASKLAGVADGTARRWLANPAKYDPFIDQVAVMRAMEGERSVWDALTVWERDVVMEKLGKRKSRLLDFEWVEFMEDLCKKLGMPAYRIGRALRWRNG